MSKKKILEKKDILHLAKLAKLQLTEQEIDKYWKQLEETVEFVKNLAQLNTGEVKPTSHITSLQSVFFADEEKNTRNFSLERALNNAKNKKNNFFVVKRIL